MHPVAYHHHQAASSAVQARSKEHEAQFAATTAELEALKGKQKALEARNLLLEKLVSINKQQQQQPRMEDYVSSQVLRHCGLTSGMNRICFCHL